MEGNTGEPDTGEPDAESLRVFREVLGAFKSFVPAAVAARRLEADPVFARHIALDLSLPAELALESVNPGWEQVTVHAFMLRPDLAVRLNSQLRKVALGLERAGGGLQVSNVGAFHSKRLGAETRSLVKLRNAAARAARAAHRDEEGSRADRPTQPTSLWANVSRSGHYHGLHDHADATWSGVYYVQVPPAGADYSGRIAFRTAVGGVPGGILAAQAGRRAFAMDPQRPEGWCVNI
ncbi:hypothetical protein T492DRAFT_435213 [Pavlovales sp. CCMP2436]|nr:hypothetical protein T492DRAFT_435213 [Pavlovales sp. CCMP2436]